MDKPGSAAKSQPIIVIKKKGGHGGHHGGAWKVAYADFVTAMMSLFIVLWLMGSSSKVKEAVAGYFNDPKGTGALLGTTLSGTGETVTAAQNEQMQKLKEKLEAEIKAKKELEKLSKQIEITITAEGLRIELIEDKNGVFFQSGSPQLSATGQELLDLLAVELKTLPNNLLIEGHTDATKYSTDANYSNWELSADRANSARRLLQQGGVREDQVTQVRGYADQFLRVKGKPYDPSNRRISILVKNGGDGAAPVIKKMPGVETGPVAAPVPAAAKGGEGKEAAGEKKGEEKKAEEKKPGAAPEQKAGGAAPEQKASAPIAKPAAGTPAAPAKQGLMGRLMGMLPGKKK